MICEKCGKEFKEDFRKDKATIRKTPTPRFCSKSCANGHTKTEAQKTNISKGMLSKSEKWQESYITRYGRPYDEDKKYVKPKIPCVICGIPRGWNNKLGMCKKCYSKTDEYSKTVSMATKGKTGGLRKGSGIGKKGWYKGFYCRSSWELAWLVYQLDNNKKVLQTNEHFEYEFEGSKHRYYPDFLIDDVWYEIKGRRESNVQAKIDQFPKDKKLVLIEGKKEIKPFLEYAKNKYGDFLYLYEKSDLHKQ
jgi:hypothetical protein